jgi:hypothetical protein
MKEITKVIELQTNDDEKKLLLVTRYLVEINFTFDLSVKSGSFSGTSHFCLRIGEIEAFCETLMKMHTSLSGAVRLDDNDSDSFIKIEMEHDGHLKVSGQVGDSHNDHFMKFAFLTDQTCIPQLVADLTILLDNQGNLKLSTSES